MGSIGLVLEGGGMRGAYTAGCLAWLKDHNIKFDYSVGISSGALYLACFLEDRMDAAYNMSTKYAADSNNVGMKAFMREGHYVAYKYIFDNYLKEKEHLSVEKIKNEHMNMEIGSYDLEQGETVYFNSEDLDDDMELLLAACALPIASATVSFEGRKLLDGGITKMIPIERALEQDLDKYFVITTKPADYVRKPVNGFMRFLMKANYPKYKQLHHDYAIRHVNYNKQMSLIYSLVDEGKAYMVRPSRTIPVSRFKGEEDKLKELYELGYQDMEDQKELILSFLEKGE